MKFKEFCEYLDKIEGLNSRNTTTEVLAELIDKLEANEVRPAMYLMLGRLGPKYDPLEFNYSVKLLLKTLGNINPDIESIYKRVGDVGIATAEIVKNDKSVWDIHAIYKALYDFAIVTGTGSQATKATKLLEIMASLTTEEAKYISRIMVGKVRLGFNEKTILDALSWYLAGSKEFKKQLEFAFGVRCDIGYIAELIKSSTKDNVSKKLEAITVVAGTPVASKLVEREKNVAAIYERMANFFVQPKLDGLRAQIHLVDDKEKGKYVQIFSRNGENITDMFPDLAEAMKQLPVDSVVFDSEAIGFNRETGEYLEFQETMQRKRKHSIQETAKDIPIMAMCFDILALNGEDYSRKPIEERIKRLEELIGGDKWPIIKMLETVHGTTPEEMEKIFVEALDKNLEGVIVKKAETIYEPGTRNYDWIKLKASSREDMVDTVDAVVLGYYLGTGVRNKLGIGALLIGTYNADKDEYYTIAKVGTGITEEQFGVIKFDLDKIKLDSKPENYKIAKQLTPDVFVEPKIVVVVESDSISRSKVHTAGINEEGMGISMRFPRLKVWNRTDKDVDSITSEKELEKMLKLSEE